MSRTYRRAVVHLYYDNKPFSYFKRRSKENIIFFREHFDRQRVDYYSKHNLKVDGQPFAEDYGYTVEKVRRMRVRAFMRKKDYDNIPFFKKELIKY